MKKMTERYNLIRAKREGYSSLYIYSMDSNENNVNNQNKNVINKFLN
jgi:hypothetical protein